AHVRLRLVVLHDQLHLAPGDAVAALVERELHADELQLAEYRERALERVHHADLDRRLRSWALRPAGSDPGRDQAGADRDGDGELAHTSSLGHCRDAPIDRAARGESVPAPRGPLTPLRRGGIASRYRDHGAVLQHATLVGLGEHGLDRLHELARRIHAELDRHAGARPHRLVDEVDVERVLERQIVRMVVRDVGLADLEPLRPALAAPFELHLVRDHRAHWTDVLPSSRSATASPGRDERWGVWGAIRGPPCGQWRFFSRNAQTFFHPSAACSCRYAARS